MFDLGPVDLHETSVTERADFRQCRRKWFLVVVKRLQPHGGAPYFWFGNLLHYALEHYYVGQRDGMSLQERETWAREAYDHFLEESLPGIREDLGFLWESAEDEYADMIAMGRAMLTGYFQMERETGGMGDPIAVEERYRVTIRTRAGRAFPGSPELTGRFDLVVERPDGTIWVVDHKTAGQKHSSAYLDLDDQLTGYAYVYWRATGVLPRGQVYNVLLKKAPREPTLLKSGKLSRARDEPTTYSLYLKAIKRLGLDRREYQEHLDWLKDRGWTDFYIQEGVFRNMAQLEQFELNLAEEWRDMRDVAAHPERAYPSPSSINCPGCPVKMLCATMQDGGDVEAIIEQQYSIAPPRR